MSTKFVNILETSKLRIRGQYLDSDSCVLLHFLTLRLRCKCGVVGYNTALVADSEKNLCRLMSEIGISMMKMEVASEYG